MLCSFFLHYLWCALFDLFNFKLFNQITIRFKFAWNIKFTISSSLLMCRSTISQLVSTHSCKMKLTCKFCVSTPLMLLTGDENICCFQSENWMGQWEWPFYNWILMMKTGCRCNKYSEWRNLIYVFVVNRLYCLVAGPVIFVSLEDKFCSINFWFLYFVLQNVY